MSTDLERSPPHKKITLFLKFVRHGFTLTSYGGLFAVFDTVLESKFE